MIAASKNAIVNNAIRLLNKQIDAAKQLKFAFLREVFASTQMNTWADFALGEICTFVGGMQPPKSVFKYQPEDGYTRLVQIQDFRTSEFPVYIPAQLAARNFNVDDVMIGRYGPPLFQILRGLSGSYNVALIKCVPSVNLYRGFLFYLLQEERIQNAVIAQSQRSAGQTGVQKSYLEKYKVKIPSIEQQISLSCKLDEKFTTTAKLQTALNERLQDFWAARNSLITTIG